jgi:hypothetical protein
VKNGRPQKETPEQRLREIEYYSLPEIDSEDSIAKKLLLGKFCLSCKFGDFREMNVQDQKTGKTLRSIFTRSYCYLNPQMEERPLVEPYHTCEHWGQK